MLLAAPRGDPGAYEVTRRLAVEALVNGVADLCKLLPELLFEDGSRDSDCGAHLDGRSQPSGPYETSDEPPAATLHPAHALLPDVFRRLCCHPLGYISG